MEWLKAREPTASYMDALIEDAKSNQCVLLMSTINQGEIFYLSCGLWGEARADSILSQLHVLPIEVVHPISRDVLSAARIKSRFKIAYADAFAAILGIEFGASVLTGDPDFLRLREEDLISVEWLGA